MTTKSQSLHPESVTQLEEEVTLFTMTHEEGERWRNHLSRLTKVEIINTFLYVLELWNKDDVAEQKERKIALSMVEDKIRKDIKTNLSSYLYIIYAMCAFAQTMSESSDDSYPGWEAMRVQLANLHDCLESELS